MRQAAPLGSGSFLSSGIDRLARLANNTALDCHHDHDAEAHRNENDR